MSPDRGAAARGAVLLAATALVSGCTGPVTLEPVDVDAAGRAACARLVARLPETVADQQRREVSPAGALGAAWGDPPIELRCGVPEPPQFAREQVCTTVDGVDWFIPGEQLDSEEPVALTMTAVDRTPYVEVRMPAQYAPHATTLVDVGAALQGLTPRAGCP